MSPDLAGIRRSARVALEQLRLSFLIGVALVPTLLTQVFLGVQHWMPWWGWSLLLLAVIVGLFSLGVSADRRLLRRLTVAHGEVRSVRDLDTITDLVVTVHLGKPAPQNLHTLLRSLPGVQHVHLIVGRPPGGGVDDPEAVRALMSDTGCADLPVQVLAHLPIAEINPVDVATVQERLAGLAGLLGPGRRAVVDVTGGTVPMSLSTYRAAAGAGLPVTYTSSLPPRSPGGHYTFRALVAVHDPRTELTEGVV